MVTILNTNKVHSDLAEQYWHKKRIIIPKWSRTLIETSQNLLEEKKRKFIMSTLKGLENRGQQCTGRVW